MERLAKGLELPLDAIRLPRSMFRLPCCGQFPLDAEPGLVVRDRTQVTCTELADAELASASYFGCRTCLTPIQTRVEPDGMTIWSCPTHGDVGWKADFGELDLGLVRERPFDPWAHYLHVDLGYTGPNRFEAFREECERRG